MNKRVLVYSAPTCPHCVQAKKFLEDNNIEFEEIDVSVHPDRADEMINKSGRMGVPVLDIDGDIILGFDPARIRKSLGF